MPHAVDEFELQEQHDDAEIARLLDPNANHGELDVFARDLEVGEKADDAEDFEDIGDDDLPDEEEGTTTLNDGQDAQDTTDDFDPFADGHDLNASGAGEGFEDDTNFDFGDDLFGEDDQLPQTTEKDEPLPIALPVQCGGLALPSKTRLALPGAPAQKNVLQDASMVESPTSTSAPHSDDLADEEPTQTEIKLEAADEEEDEEWAMQKALFAAADKEREERLQRGGLYVPRSAQEDELETFYTIWPTYDPDETPHFTQLFPPRRGIYGWKTPLKPPKPILPSKLNLELQQDQERSFRLPNTNKTGRESGTEHQGVIFCNDIRTEQEHSDDGIDFDEIDENEQIGTVSWQDLTLICEDWSLPSVASSPEHYSQQQDSGVDVSHDLHHDSQEPPSKKRKTSHFDLKAAVSIHHTYPSLENPERATARLAKKIELDMNDPGLLLDENVSAAPPKKLRRVAGDARREVKSAMARDMSRRYNISNDEAYELLKENHQHKIRSTLGSMAVEHSLPATKLQYPFYKVNLDDAQKRSFHRPAFAGERPNRTINFSKLKRIKRKELRGKEIAAIFAKSEDLSMADNSNALLLEYSEEFPVMLSNFGMGNRLINYYRRKDAEDSARPKEEIGETQVLLPQDRSPFANFGQVDPGELVPTIHNGLYRAPIFKHESKSTDFLIICSSSNQTGRKYTMRNMENLYAVGQQLPSVEVPGEHSRKVTDAAKRRLRALSYRVVRKHEERRGPPLTNEVVRIHLPGSDIAQNRGKMREFMQYDKNNQLWHLKNGDAIPDNETLRGWIKPEDICVLDSMQVGVQYLRDLGLRKDDEENDDDDAKEGTNIELQLAPWNTTKNFLNACQGKAMLQLHGEGDPSGRGEAFSLIKTSMKGGFRALGESIEERLDAKRLKENGGHSYNVARQQKAYDESIRRIWKAQHDSLSSTLEQSEEEADDDEEEPENATGRGATPRSTIGGTPSVYARRDDESASQFSKFSANQGNKIMYITRQVKDKYGNFDEVVEKITNPRVIAAYKKRKGRQMTGAPDIPSAGLPEEDEATRRRREEMQAEIDRLQRNMDRRVARERAKGIISPSAGSPNADGEDGDNAPATSKKGRKKNTEGTARKCANCGQVGHIKTNKKLCPMLNGTMKQEDVTASGFGGVATGGLLPPGGGVGEGGANGFGGVSAALQL